jgi:hypothetical protein
MRVKPGTDSINTVRYLIGRRRTPTGADSTREGRRAKALGTRRLPQPEGLRCALFVSFGTRNQTCSPGRCCSVLSAAARLIPGTERNKAEAGKSQAPLPAFVRVLRKTR